VARGTATGQATHLRALIANVEIRMAEFLRSSLEKNGISVEIESDIFDAVFGDSEEGFDCIIMQADPVTLQELCATGQSDSPILAIVEEATVDARVRALDAGADDCLKSPFAISELVARIRSLARRFRRTSASEATVSALHDFEYVRDLKLVKRSDRNVALTQTEDVILGHLLENVGNV
jgi:DNA-binding response OmpR family regulator